MTAPWKADKGWADRLQPEVIEILRRASMRVQQIEIADAHLDMRQATDLVVTTDVGQVAWRARRGDCQFRDLTLRLGRRDRPNAEWRRGYEVDKILDGFADHYLYTWVVP